ncbi:hypothetical protein B5807_01919 [Epicoccum nigrum]|uniref:Uncharacterized protein n=1 Tax=Epicoccum nigrum TaxID=105696 RepID=A0A1Y2M898_EPING|nr:hypothetical protein B5807_01919 [Epicoccum nigrum]
MRFRVAANALLLPALASAAGLSPRATPVHVTFALCQAVGVYSAQVLTAAADLNRASTSRPLFHPPVFVKPFLDRESEFSLSTPFLSPTFAVQVPVTFRVHARPICSTRPQS